MSDPWRAQLETLGSFIRIQRQLSNLTLREMANRTSISNAYLSQIERGLHEPSVRVLRSIAAALGISPEALLTQAGLLDDEAEAQEGEGEDEKTAKPPKTPSTEAAIRADPRLTEAQKKALLAVYTSFVTGTSDV
ncbi:MAG: helix-turn-helix domain-containing protein [Actinomycetota bacterium]|nr:helix-turn-helix domain-containing protein [Actinomycetota bacterium]